MQTIIRPGNGIIVPTPGVQVLQPRTADGGVVFLVQDDFTDTADPVGDRDCTPGPGKLDTVTDTNSVVATDGTSLEIDGASGPNSWADPGLIFTDDDDNGFARAAGLMLHARYESGTSTLIYGWNNSATPGAGSNSTPMWYGSSGSVWKIRSETQVFLASSAGDDMFIILRGSGAWFVQEDKLIYVSRAGSDATMWPMFTGKNATYEFSTVRVAQLDAPWNTDDGIATDTVDGSVSNGSLFTHEADFLIEWTQTTVPSSEETEIRFRIQNSSNYWRITIDSSGDIDLDEVVSGTPTQRGTSAGSIINGRRIVVIADDDDIEVFSNEIRLFAYPSASNFSSETDGEMEATGTGGAVDDIKVWPRTLSGSALSGLQGYLPS